MVGAALMETISCAGCCVAIRDVGPSPASESCKCSAGEEGRPTRRAILSTLRVYDRNAVFGFPDRRPGPGRAPLSLILPRPMPHAPAVEMPRAAGRIAWRD